MKTVDDLCLLIEQNLNDADRLASEKIAADTPLLVSGLLDSLTIMRIVAQVEQRTGISFPQNSVVAANFRTPLSLWNAIADIRAGAGQCQGEPA